ncbi:MAG TPA: RNA methyltransferase [bacterium]|nr:RNA methyltransferase [bacterium]
MPLQAAFLPGVNPPTPALTLTRPSARQLTAWRKLLTKKGRREAGEVLIEGARLVGEALAAGADVTALVIADDEQGRAALRKLAEQHRLTAQAIYTAAPREFAKLTDTVHAAGIACVIKWRAPRFDAARRDLARTLVCDRISDPGNLGTLVRTAAGLGLDAVILLAGTAELANPKTLRAAMGAVYHIPVFVDAAAPEVIDWAAQAGVTLFVADAHGGREPETAPARWALVIGSETIPLDPAWAAAGVARISLPLHRGVESFNAAIAGAILMDRLCRPAASG